MSTYLKNMAGYKHNQLKNIQKLFDKAMKRVNSFVDMDTKLVEGSEVRVEGSEIRVEGSSKRAGEELEQEIKAKHGSTRPEEGYERVLWGDLKTMFDPHFEDQGRIVGIKRLLDDLKVTTDKVCVTAAKQKRREERSLNNNPFLGEYECSSLALDRDERRDKKKRLDHLKQDQTMLVIKRFSERKKVFRERKKTERIRAKSFASLQVFSITLYMNGFSATHGMVLRYSAGNGAINGIAFIFPSHMR
ncbi:hypothetical protein Tco_1237901 [Tanacetum coccineum]